MPKLLMPCILAVILCSFAATTAFSESTVRRNDKARAATEAKDGIRSFTAAGPSRSQAARGQPRIINGDDVPQDDGDWAWTISLRFDNRHICGGSLVAPQVSNNFVNDWAHDDAEAIWVVTAAHCVWNDAAGQADNPASYDVESGNVTLGASERLLQKVKKIFVHQDYDPLTTRNDIALLKLEKVSSIPSGVKRTSIMLPHGNDASWLYQRYTALNVTGWGRTESGPMSSRLQRVLVPFVDRKDCQEAYELHGEEIATGMMCGGYSSGGYDSCQGDSGGPIFFRPARAFGDPVDRPMLAGVVSWGIGCALEGLYGVYTNVLTYKPWLERTVLANQ